MTNSKNLRERLCKVVLSATPVNSKNHFCHFFDGGTFVIPRKTKAILCLGFSSKRGKFTVILEGPRTLETLNLFYAKILETDAAQPLT